MKDIIYDEDNIIIYKYGTKFFIRYDAGSHQVAIREDEIDKCDAELIIQDRDNLMKVLMSLQKKLISNGEKPYKSNI